MAAAAPNITANHQHKINTPTNTRKPTTVELAQARGLSLRKKSRNAIYDYSTSKHGFVPVLSSVAEAVAIRINKAPDVESPHIGHSISNPDRSWGLVVVTNNGGAHIRNDEVSEPIGAASGALAVLIADPLYVPPVPPLPAARGSHELVGGLEILCRNSRLGCPL